MQEATQTGASNTDRNIKEQAAGDRHVAFALTAQHYLPSLARHAAKVVKNEEEAMEIAVETIISSMKEPKLLNPEFRIGACLYRVAFNRALNALRDRKRREEFLVWYGSALVPSGPSDPEKSRATKERTSTVDRLLRRLASEHEAIIRLRYHEGLDYLEIANRLGVPIGTVMSRLSRAHARIREHVQSEELRQKILSVL